MALTEEGLIELSGVRSGWVRLANGARAHYVTAGEKGPAIILLHGGLPGSCSIAGWRFMLSFLAEQGFRVYAPDRPGFGLADTREEYWPRYSIFSWVDFVHDFAAALCLDRFHLAGNSQGAGITAQYVIEHSERIISFILIASYTLHNPLGLDRDGTGRNPFAIYHRPVWDGKEETMRSMMESIINRRDAITDDLITMRTNFANLQLDAFAAHDAFLPKLRTDPNFAQRARLVGRLDKLTIPGLYLYGMNDVMATVDAGYEQEDVLPNIQFFYPEDCGHQGQTDQPEMFNQVFLEFFRDGKVSRQTADWAGVSKRRPELADRVVQTPAS